nr:MAG TPA: major capsid protein [Caudoviricetes sp.]
MADPAAKHTLDKLLAGENKGVFPPEVIENIWTQAYKGSVMQSIAQTTPIPLSGAALPVPVGQPTAGVVAEGGDKPAVEVSFSTRTIKPIKVAAGVVLSEEVVRRSPVMAYLSLQKKLSESIARAMDNAILHGKDALTGTVLAGQTPIISANANSVEIDLTTAQKAPGLLNSVLAGVDLVEAANDDFTVDSFLARKNVRTKIIGSTDAQGRPIFQGSSNLADPVGQFLGLPIHFSNAVGGYEKAKVEETDALMIGGSFADNLVIGNVADIEMRQATEYGFGVELFRTNMIAFLAEATFGWAIRDPKAFVVYKKKA